MDKRPIGVFDSGLGGVSTLIQARSALPAEDYIYYGDNANAPYGSRGEEAIRELTLAGCEFLADRGAKAILIACNTATAAAYELLRESLSLPVVGIEPAILPAAALPGDGLILMMATEATVRLPRYRELRKRLPHQDRVRDVACPAELVRRVERGLFSPGSYDDLLEDVLYPYKGQEVAAVVLGCTHYPFIQPEIAQYAARHFPRTPRFFDGGKSSIAALQSVLMESGLHNGAGSARVDFYTSGDASLVRSLFEGLLSRTLDLA